MRALAELIDDDSVPLEELALAVTTRFERAPIEAVRGALDELAAGVALPDAPAAAAEALASHLHGRHRFRGATEDYYDPRHSDLAYLLEARRGLPLTLSLLYIAVARRAGREIEPIGFPGHFLVRHGGPGGVHQDPFHGGRLLDDAALAQLGARFLGHASRLEAEHLLPIGRKALAVRMLANLRNAHRRRGDAARALLACDLLVDVTGAPEARRDRGLHALELGAVAADREDLEAYLEARPRARDAERVRAALHRTSSGPTLH